MSPASFFPPKIFVRQSGAFMQKSKKTFALLSLAHSSNDICWVMIPLLLPLIREQLHLTYMQSGLLLSCFFSLFHTKWPFRRCIQSRENSLLRFPFHSGYISTLISCSLLLSDNSSSGCNSCWNKCFPSGGDSFDKPWLGKGYPLWAI